LQRPYRGWVPDVMHPYPHSYTASAHAADTGSVTVRSPELPAVQTAPPPQFGGPPGVWSPETLLCASVADCFVLTFRSVARAAGLEWKELECRVEGRLERREGQSLFTRFTTNARLSIASGQDTAKARQLLEQAEHGCLVANSLRAASELTMEVSVAEGAAVASG